MQETWNLAHAVEVTAARGNFPSRAAIVSVALTCREVIAATDTSFLIGWWFWKPANPSGFAAIGLGRRLSGETREREISNVNISHILPHLGVVNKKKKD